MTSRELAMQEALEMVDILTGMEQEKYKEYREHILNDCANLPRVWAIMISVFNCADALREQ